MRDVGSWGFIPEKGSCLGMVPIMLLIITLTCGCSPTKAPVINIGYIGPLSTRATDLGIGPSKALVLAVDEYNATKKGEAPTVNLFLEDDKWEGDLALPAYEKLRAEHDIDIVFVSNSDGTVALQNSILRDDVILVNPLNNDTLLSSMNKNTFKIAKSSEETHKLIGVRILELGLHRIAIFQYPNEFMKGATRTLSNFLESNGIESEVVVTSESQLEFGAQLQGFKDRKAEGYVFFGYEEFGFAMKQGRDLGIEAPYFGSTTLLTPTFYDNSEGEIVGTECTFFTPEDGNHVLAAQFLDDYENKFGATPFSVWPPMQAYDAMSLVLSQIEDLDRQMMEGESFSKWLREKLLSTRYYPGICGNLSIREDGASRGIYFSLYRIESKGGIEKVIR